MSHKILVVDDEQSILLAIRTLMELEGFEVEIATDGKTGLALYHDFKPDLILVDVMMPKLNGYEMVRQIRADPQSLETRIIYPPRPP